MFDTFVLDRRIGPRAGWLVTAWLVAIALLAAALVALIVHSYWTIDRLTPRYRSISFVPTIAPPAPPPPASAPPPPRAHKRSDAPRKLAQVVQPVEIDEPPAASDPTTDAADELTDGPDHGVPGGTDPNGVGTDPNGVPGGVPFAPPTDTTTLPTPPPVERKDPPKVVPIDAIKGQLVAGVERIPLPRDVKRLAHQQGNLRLSAIVKLCLDRAGVPDRLELVKSTGYDAADQAILVEMKNWRYRPYTVNDRPVPVCTAVTFQYIIED